jgi:hypothetical protein
VPRRRGFNPLEAWSLAVTGGALAWAVHYLALPQIGYALPAVAWLLSLLGASVRRAVGAVLVMGVRRWWIWAGPAGLIALWRWAGPWWIATAIPPLALTVLALCRRDRTWGDPTKDVNPPPPGGLLERSAERWEEAARRAAIHHPDEPEMRAPLLGEPHLNGVGGVAFDVDLAPVRGDLDVLRSGDRWIRRVLGCSAVFVEGRPDEWGPWLARIHAYEGTPLRDVIDWRALARFAGEGERVPVIATAYGTVARIRARRTRRYVGLTQAGKTNAIMVGVHSAVAVQKIPLRVAVIDNRGSGIAGGSGSELAQLRRAAIRYVNRSEDVWDAIRPVLQILAGRQARLGQLGGWRYSRDEPVVWLVVTELLSALRHARPPVAPPAGMGWDEYTLGRWDGAADADGTGDGTDDGTDDGTATAKGKRKPRRPTVAQWRDMILSAFIDISREGESVGVAGQYGMQAAQVDQVPGGLRQAIASAVAFRLDAESDVKPALGVGFDVAPAHLIDPETQLGCCYIRDGDTRPAFGRYPLIPPGDLERAVVFPLSRVPKGDTDL